MASGVWRQLELIGIGFVDVYGRAFIVCEVSVVLGLDFWD